MNSYVHERWLDEQQERPYYLKLKFKDVRTHKRHLCASCHEFIEAGEMATAHAFIDDDRKFVSEYFHIFYSCPKFLTKGGAL